MHQRKLGLRLIISKISNIIEHVRLDNDPPVALTLTYDMYVFNTYVYLLFAVWYNHHDNILPDKLVVLTRK